MTRKTIGIIVSVLLIATMIVIMVKSNINETEPIESVGGITGSGDAPIEEVGLDQGNTPPDFELETLSGDVVKLSDLKGKKVILNFWASWCGPCKAEMPHMEKYYKKYKDSENVEIVAVNLTTAERRGMEGVTQFIESYGLTFPIPLDVDGDVSEDYSVITIPTTFLLGTDGKLAQKIVGPMDESMIEELVNNLN